MPAIPSTGEKKNIQTLILRKPKCGISKTSTMNQLNYQKLVSNKKYFKVVLIVSKLLLDKQRCLFFSFSNWKKSTTLLFLVRETISVLHEGTPNMCIL